MEKEQSKLEAILFAAGEPVETKSLASFFNVSTKEMDKMIDKLEENYRSEKRGLQIIKKGNTIQLVSYSEFGKLVAKFLNKKLHEPLSGAALEVLSVIAYRGPVTRSQIEHIRGVNCSFTLRNLAIKGIIERRENPADTRSYLYEVSFDFLKNSGLSSTEELPDYDELHRHKIPQIPNEEKNIDKEEKTNKNEKL